MSNVARQGLVIRTTRRGRPAAFRQPESHFLETVRSLAATLGWASYHTHNSERSEPGWPDLAMVRGDRLVLAELKAEDGKVTPEQERWLELLGAVRTVEVHLWRPSDMSLVLHTLSRRRPT